jgi:hypothetical protein
MKYVLIPGRSGRAWYWHLVTAELWSRGHESIAVELTSDDDTKGLHDFAGLCGQADSEHCLADTRRTDHQQAERCPS